LLNQNKLLPQSERFVGAGSQPIAPVHRVLFSFTLRFFLAEFLSLDESQFKFGGISVRFIFVEEKRSIGQEERKVETSSFFRINILFRTCRLEIEPENQTTFSGLRKKNSKILPFSA
jgi:hypothetical protein